MTKRELCVLMAVCTVISAMSGLEVRAESGNKQVEIAVTEEALNSAKALENFQNMGVNFEMSFTSDEMWQSNGNWMEQTYANSGIKMLRWGYDAWVFDWQDEVPLNSNYQGGMNTKDALGTRGFREFVTFAAKHGITPFVHIPFESWNHKNGNTVEEKKQDPTYQNVLNLAVNMAVYMKEQGIEKAYFDLGNEPAQAPSCPYGTFTAEEYGKAFPDFYEAIKEVSPSYKLVMQIESTKQYNEIKKYAVKDGKYCFDAVDKHVYNSNDVGWEGYYNRKDDDVFKTDITVDAGIEKIMGECNVPWPNFPTYSTNLGAALCLVNGFAKLAQDDEYSSIIMWPSQWASDDTMYNAFNPTGKSFGWFDQNAWYDGKETKRLNGPVLAEMMAQKFTLSHKVNAVSNEEKVRTFAFTNEEKSELNIFMVNKEKDDATVQLQVPKKFNKVKAVALTGEKDEQGMANTDETPDYHGHLSNCDVTNGQYSDQIQYGECAIVYTFYQDEQKEVPGNFQVKTPDHQAVDVSTAVNFQWNDAKNASDYKIVLSENEDLSNPILETTTGGKSNYQMPEDLKASGTYYWSVSAINRAGETTVDGNIHQFRTAGQRHFVDDSDASITYEGGWIEQAYRGSFGRKDHGTGQPGDVMTIRFQGTQAILYGIRDNWIRKISVKVDEKEPEIIDLYESRGVLQYREEDPAHYSRGGEETEEQKKVRLDSIRPTQQVLYDTGKLSDEDQEHTIVVEVLEELNQNVNVEASSSWRGFEFDYYEIIKSGETSLKTAADLPEFTTLLPQSQNAVEGQRFELTAQAVSSDQGEISYEWYKDGRLLEGQTAATLTIDSFEKKDVGTYQVRATNSINNSITRTASGGICTVQLK